MAVLLLTGAVLTQTVGILALRASGGMRRGGFAALSLGAIASSVALMAQAIDRGLSLAVGYGIWSGAGIALGAAGGAMLFGDRLSARQVGALAVLVAGVVVVRVGAPE